MKNSIKFDVTEKPNSGSKYARIARYEGKIPCIVYGGDSEKMFSVSRKEFVKEYEKGAIGSKLIELSNGKKSISVLVRDVQLHPVSDLPIHIDFEEVTGKKKVKLSLHVFVQNKDKSPGLKKGGTLNLAKRKIPVLVDPENIPHGIDVDLSGIEIGKIVHINDIKLPGGIEVVQKSNFTVLTISGRKEKATADTDPEKA